MAATYAMTSESNPTRAIGISVAVIDDSTLKRLSADQVRSLQTAFRTKVSGTRSAAADWNDYLNANWNAYPKALATGVKVFERYVPLP
jgi:hypothetical protein